MMLIAMLALAAQAASTPDGWVEFGRNDQLTQSIDARSIRVEGDRRTLRHRAVFSRPMPDGTVSVTFDVEVNCGRRTITLLGGATRNGAGETIQDHQLPASARQAEAPESEAQEAMLQLACSLSSN